MKNCNICYLRDAKPCYECSACMAGDSHFRPAPKAKKQSNADRIRAMSDEDCNDAECFEYCGMQIWNGF